MSRCIWVVCWRAIVRATALIMQRRAAVLGVCFVVFGLFVVVVDVCMCQEVVLSSCCIEIDVRNNVTVDRRIFLSKKAGFTPS